MFQLAFPLPYDQSVWYLQWRLLSTKFWWATKSNKAKQNTKSRNRSTDSYSVPQTAWFKHPMGTQSVSGDRDSVCTFKRVLRLLTFRRDVLFSFAHNSSSFEGQFFVCYWIVRAELLAIGKPVTMHPETFIHHKLCIASSSLQWVEAMPQQKMIVCSIFWRRPWRQKQITWKKDPNAYGLHCSWAPFSL